MIGDTLLSTLDERLFGCIVLIATFIASRWLIRRSEDSLRRRFGSQIAEAIKMISTALVIAAEIAGFATIWNADFVLREVVNAIVVDQWTLVQQLVTMAVFIIAYLLVRFTNRSIAKLSETKALTEHQTEIAYHVSNVGIFLAAIGIVLSLWGIDLTNFFISAGVMSVMVGLAARTTLAAMVSGFVLLFSRPFRVGDWIEIGERSGVVKDVTIFNTKLQTFDGKSVLIPNDEITDNGLRNISENNQLRLEIQVGVDYETDLEHAENELEKASEKVEGIKSTPAPQVIIREFESSSILFELRVWIENPTSRRRWRAKTNAIKAIKTRFDAADISIPFPQRVYDGRDEKDEHTSQRQAVPAND
jgi:small conductance mechanosensitive channel